MAEATLHKLATHQNNTHDQTHLKARATNSSSREMETAMAWHGMASPSFTLVEEIEVASNFSH